MFSLSDSTLAFRMLMAIIIAVLFSVPLAAEAAAHAEPAYAGSDQVSRFPTPLDQYDETPGTGLKDTFKNRIAKDPFNLAATIVFLLAILHTFLAGPISRAAHDAEVRHQARWLARNPEHIGATPSSLKAAILHYIGEVEAIFGIWVLVLGGVATYFYSWTDFVNYLSHDRIYTEPLFVMVVMTIAASRPILGLAEKLLSGAAKLGGNTPTAWWLSILLIAPILGSFITEPAAMTIAALLLSKRFFVHGPDKRLAYATIGLLFVNISVGGTLTHFAAPPVLMVAGKWGWDSAFLLTHFGYKSVIGIILATVLYYAFFRQSLRRLEASPTVGKASEEDDHEVPWWLTALHLAFLGFTVFTCHYPPLFIGGFLFYLALVGATQHYQSTLSMRSPILVAFFLAALVIHGGLQSWWIAPILTHLDDQMIMLGATILTAFNDNAAITYLASTVPGLNDSAKYAVVAGAVVGGGLTVIANAPNPAGQSILQKHFGDHVSPGGLALAAALPTVILYAALVWLPSL